MSIADEQIDRLILLTQKNLSDIATHTHDGIVTNGDSHDHSGGDGAQIAYGGLSGLPLLQTVMDIGDWNMDATASVNVAHGLTLSKIRHVRVAVRHDDGSVTVPFPFSGDNTVYADATNIILTRDSGGPFDGTGYDSTSYNRGWIIIDHTV